MVGVEERIRTELEILAAKGDGSGDVFANVVRKRQRRRIVRKIEFAGLVVAVVVGTLAGTYALSRVFEASRPRTPLAPAVSNGLLALSMDDQQHKQYIAVMNPDGSGLRAITFGAADEEPAWSPDGTRIAFWRAPQEKSAGIWVANADGTDAHPLLQTQDSIEAIAWSPGGSKIAWVDVGSPPFSGTELDFPQDLYAMSSDGTGATAIVTDGQVTDFAWSPDGNHIVLERQSGLPDYRLGYDLSVVSVDGTGETPLTQDHISMDPAWAPGGTMIAFVGSSSGGWKQRDLFVMNADGSDRKQITTGAGAVENPTWSPDGTKIAFATFPNADGSACELTVVDPDGSNPVAIADKSSLSGCPIGISWQPVPVTGSEPTPTGPTSTEPTQTPSALVTTPPWRDAATDLPGVGKVCGLTSVGADFTGMGLGMAFVFEPESDGGCAGPNENFQHLGIAPIAGGPVEYVSPKLRECGVPEGCWAFSTPDVNGDGRAEVAVATAESTSIFFQIWSLVPCGPAADCTQPSTLEPLSISAPGDPAEGFPPGPAVFRWGGAPDDTAGVRCDTTPKGKPELIEWFTASSEAHFDIAGVELTLTAEIPWDASLPPTLGDMCGSPVSGPGE